VPTIAVATDGGVSVIKDDGTVVDLTYLASTNNEAGGVWFPASGGIAWQSRSASGGYVYTMAERQIPASDKSTAPDAIYANFGQGGAFSDLVTVGYLQPQSFLDGAIGSPDGLTHLAENTTTSTNGMVAYTTSDYSTGWMPGDIKGAWLASTDDTDLVASDTIADRSVNANGLAVNGTVTKTAVATGAELVAYSGFSATNYLEQPYNSDLDFGTGDFCVMTWLNPSGDGIDYFWGRGLVAGMALGYNNFSGAFTAYLQSVLYTTTKAFTGWGFLAYVRDNGIFKIYLNGELIYSAASTENVSGATPVTYIGVYSELSSLVTAGSLALVRASATAPTDEQIRKIYNDEKWMFQPGAQVTLNGSSDAVTALAHDKVTDLLHVGTSGGMSVFDGLVRVSEDATAVTTSISANNSRIVRQ